MSCDDVSRPIERIEFGAEYPVFALQFFTPGVSDHTYLVVSGGKAALIDPQRDYQRFLDAADAEDASLSAVFETHIHNDYVSGGMLAAKTQGAKYVLPANSGARMPHDELGDGESVKVGECRVVAMHTPGHTPHHTSYVLECNGERLAVFTGGSMLIAGAGRTDLISPDMTEELAHSQFHSVRRIAGEMPDPATVGPTHGGGSFCGSGVVGETLSTISEEKRRNPALLAKSEDDFVQETTAGYRLYPDYYAHMGPINAAGLGREWPELPADVSPSELNSLSHDHMLIDVRQAEEFAKAHVPGSVNIPYPDAAAVYAGWALPWDQPTVLIAASPKEARCAIDGFLRIGMDRVKAVVTDGLTLWVSEGRTVGSYRVAGFDELDAERPDVVLDVRDPKEYLESRIPWAVNIHFSQLLNRFDEVPRGTVWVHCESGLRSSIAASIVAAQGRDVVLVNDHIGMSTLVRSTTVYTDN